MYSTSFLSFLILIFISSASATSTPAYPVSDQLPLIARVGQPYSWSISPATFATVDSGISASSLPSWLSFSNYTFSGTPGPDDEGTVNVTLQADGASDSFVLCVTHFPPPTVRIPFADQFNGSNPSMSSVFVVTNNSALKDDEPALRVPLHWSFSIGFEYATFVNDLDLFYYAQLANGSQLPDWLTFNDHSVTFNGVAKSQEGDKLELVLIASDQEGYSAVRAPFDLFVQSHDLSAAGSIALNVTEGEDFQLDFKQEDWLFGGVTLDNTTIQADNISSLSIDTSSASWLSYDSSSLTLSGTVPPKGLFSLPMTLSAFNQSLHLDASVVLVPSYFTDSTLPGVFANPNTDFSLTLSPYISTDSHFSGNDVSLAANTSGSFLNLTTSQDGDYVISGHVPSNPKASHFDVQLSAYDHSAHAASHATLRVSIRTPNSDATASSALAQHQKLVLGLGIGLGGAAGMVVLAGMLAIVRKCCRVPDTVFEPYSTDKKAKEASGADLEKGGYGWSDKAGLGVSELPVVHHAPYPGVGIGFTPSLVPGSPPAKRTTKAAFFNNMKAVVRNFSGGNGLASTRKSTISRPFIMTSKESVESLRALRTAAGLDDSTASPPYGYPRSTPDSIEAPHGDGISLGSSPTSTTGHSNETGKVSVPRQRADFGPARTTVSPSHRVRVPSAAKGSHTRRRSTDTQVTQSSGDREVDLEEAVIVTAERASSFRSARSSAYSYAPSVYTRESVPVSQITRPRLVPFTSARGVPVPVPTQISLAGPSGPREQRRVSQVAAVVSSAPAERSRAGAQEIDADAIMTDGLRYVSAFGDQDTGNHPPITEPSRSNSKRSSQATSRITGDGLSPAQTQSTYIYPSPSQSIESGVVKGRGDGSSRGSKGSRGSLMMSRILVRTGEAFSFKYPIALSHSSPALPSSSSSPSTERKLVARPLYGGSHLPSFLAHAVSTATPSLSSSGKKRRTRYEVEFWGTPDTKDIGEIVVGIFGEGDGGECVGRLVVDVVPRGA